MRRKSGLAFPIGLMAIIAMPMTASAQEATGDEAAATETAETAPAASASGEEPERFVVTGTRIKRKEEASAAPVTVLTRDELLASGLTSVGDILQRLPSSGGALNTQQNNGGNGTTGIDIRNLGQVRTLVLLNGRRHVTGGDGANVSVDVNTIPLTIVERVEVLKDGASAVYGSDAIAGVVNIITRRDFYGVEANIYSGITQRNDGAIYQVDLTTGISGEKGNIVAAVTFFDQQPIFAGEREYSDTARDLDWDAWDAAGRPDIKRVNDDEELDSFIQNGGSFGTPQGSLFDTTGALGNAAWESSGCAAAGLCFNDPDTGWRPYNGQTDAYNFQPENYLLTPNRRFNFFTQGNYEIVPSVNAFFELSYTDRKSEQLLAPTPLFVSSEGVTISGQNRFNPFGRDFSFNGRRLLEFGNRVFRQNSQTSRIVVGFEGDLAFLDVPALEDWTWDVSVNFGRTDTVNIVEGQLNTQRLQLAVGPDSGCTGSCVPLDLFGGAGSITQEMVDYLSVTAIDRGFNDQRVYQANIGGPLFEIVPGNPVGIAFGYQYRREAGADIPNPLTALGQLSGNQRDEVKGKYDVNAVYGELVAPILEDLPGVEALELNAAARYVNFSTFGGDVAFKIGLRWQITDFLAARGTFSTAYRAPTVPELFLGRQDSFPSISDPCSAVVGSSSANAAANCATDGAAGNLDTRVQILTQVGGNTELDPETATTLTGGLVLEDSLVPGLSANFDYFNISIDDAISTIGESIILAGCYESDPGERQFCELVQRDANGLITQILDTSTNVGGNDISGLDFEVRYSTPSDFGRFGANLAGTYYFDFTQTQATGFEQNVLGVYDGREPNFDWRMNGNLAWMYDIWNVGANLRFRPGIDECENNACDAEASIENPPIRRTTDSYFAADIYAGVNLESSVGQTALTLGINNVTDAIPPFIVNGFLAESDAQSYDYPGRFFYLRLTQRF